MESETYDSSCSTTILESQPQRNIDYRRSASTIGKTFSEREKGAFKAPDRKEEDELVKLYQRTGDQKAHNRLFEIRKSTISVWARRYAWVCDSEEDLFSELSLVWLRCVQKYKYEADVRPVRTKEGHLVKDENDKIKTVFKRTPFNTFLFTSFKNHILNTIKKKYSKKRLDDDGNPVEFGMKSLDFEYGEDGEGANLYELIPGVSNPEPTQIGADWIIEEISKGDKCVEDVLRKFVADGYIKDIKTACMLKNDVLKLTKRDREFLIAGGLKAHLYLKDMIVKSKKFKDSFLISSYQIYNKKVIFEVIVSDRALKSKVVKAIERAKKRLLV